MFSRGRKSAEAPSGEQEAPQVPSIISAGLRITGNLVSDGDIQLDGRVDGDIKTRKLTVGEGAVVNGKIVGEEIAIAGSVNGEITGQTVRLTKTARVVGDIGHASLAIDAGAYIEGLCKRIDTQRDAAPVGKPALQIAGGADQDAARENGAGRRLSP